MPAHLECLTPPFAGRLLAITTAKPVVIKTNKADEDAGEVRVELLEGGLVLTNRSRMLCSVNGQAQSRTVVTHGDHIQIGKQSFRLVVEDEQDGTGTASLDGLLGEAGPAPADIVPPELCSVCDQPFDELDHERGWSADGRRICRRCLSKGVKPDNLPRPAEPGAPAPVPYYDGPAGDAVGLSEQDAHDLAAPHVDDTTHQLPMPAPAESASSESDRQRRQRRLSASRLAQIEPAAQKPGLLSKVGSVFANREERRRLDQLEEERRSLLEQCGRLATTESNGFGVPEHLMGPLLKGVEVRLRLQDFSIPALERWRGLRQRLALLDAEIAALRTTLALGPDPGLARPVDPLKADQRERQDRTFKLLDGMATQDLAGAEAEAPAAEVAPEPAPAPRPAEPARASGPQKAVSGRRHHVRKHRH